MGTKAKNTIYGQVSRDLSVTRDKGQISARQVPSVTRDRRIDWNHTVSFPRRRVLSEFIAFMSNYYLLFRTWFMELTLFWMVFQILSSRFPCDRNSLWRSTHSCRNFVQDNSMSNSSIGYVRLTAGHCDYNSTILTSFNATQICVCNALANSRDSALCRLLWVPWRTLALVWQFPKSLTAKWVHLKLKSDIAKLS
jgi:hypothetical protein